MSEQGHQQPTLSELQGALAVAEVASMSGRSSFLVRADIKAGKLFAYKVGGRWRVLQKDYEDYATSLISPSRSKR